ncbi:MAG TPA: fasciclin domain-containing protein [Candidatus Obscuribacterales bacterium]
MKQLRFVALLTLVLIAFTFLAGSTSASNPESTKHRLLAAKTVQYEEKEGFERRRLDIINTLKDNEVTQFQTLLDGLEQAYELDKVLKDKGPYTLFASSDKGWKQIPTDDVQSLFGNKKKLRQVLEYSIVKGKLNSTSLKSMGSVKTMEGHEIRISEQGGNLYADKVMIKVANLPCTNGMIHVLDGVIMPPLSK